MGTDEWDTAEATAWADEVVDPQEARLPPEELGKIEKWLQPTDYNAESSEFNRHLLSRTPGTGNWLREVEPYDRWRRSPHHGGLWIKGVPGAGKSVLAASIVDHLRTTEGTDIPVLFFFFRHIVLANRHPKCLMMDWLAQLLPHSIALQGILHPLIKKGKIDTVSNNLLWDCVLKGLGDVPRAFCVADALDEMEAVGSASFFQHLNRLATFRPSKVKLLMTSRPRQDLQSFLSATSTIHISLEEEKVGREIEVFVRHRLSESTSLNAFDREHISAAIAARSKGLFLYAKLLIDQVLPKLETLAEINIKALPLHLEDMYNKMLARQAKEIGVHVEVQVALLGLITHATRPLRLREIAGHLSQKHQIGSLDKSKNIARFACHPLIQILDDETVQVIHHSFTEYLLDASRATASSAERSSQFPILDSAHVHRDLAISCMRTAAPCLGLTSDGPEDSTINLPFLSYAKDNVIRHAAFKKDINDQGLFDAIAHYCDAHWAAESGTGFAKRWVWTSSMNTLSYQKTPLHFAAYAGLEVLARQIVTAVPPSQPIWIKSVEARADNLSDDGQGEERLEVTPFGLACSNGHYEVMKLIWNAEPKEIDGNSLPKCMLETLIAKGYSRELKFLLDLGLKPEERDRNENRGRSRSKSKLVELLCHSTIECVELLLPQLMDWEVQELFCDYASHGLSHMMQVLMAHTGADASWRTERGTVLYQVCTAENKKTEHLDCVKLLLPSVEDINFRHTVIRHSNMGGASPHPEKERTVLHALAGNWHDGNHEVSVGIFELLVKAGADLEAVDGQGDTPILCLFPNSYNKSVRKPLRHLLDVGADINIRDNSGAGIIHRAVRYHIDITIMKILLDHGADINAVWRRYKTGPAQPVLALFWDDTDWASLNSFFAFSDEPEKGHEIIEMNTRGELADFLVKQGATIDAGSDGVSVLSSALQSCDLESFKLLLGARSNDSSIDKVIFCLRNHFHDEDDDDDDQWTSRSSKTREKKTPRNALLFIQALMSVGVSIESRNESGCTPLMSSVDKKELFGAFLRAGADINAKDNRGRGMLYPLVQGGMWWSSSSPSRLDRLKDLVQLGCDPLKVDNDGASLLHLAVMLIGESWRETNLEVIQQLVDYGISPRATTRTGLTPLHMYFAPDSPAQARDATENTVSLLKIFKKAEGGIDIDALDDEQLTPLHMAAVLCRSNDSLHFVRSLLDNGADPNRLSQDQRNVLHLAARARNSSVVGYLVDRVPELVHSKDAQGRTPLFDAVVSGVDESVSSLIRNGADIFVRDMHGWTPLHACAESVHEHHEWTKNEEALNSGQEAKLDRLRPYMPPHNTPRSEKDEPIQFTPYLRPFKHRRDETNGGNPHTLENTEMAIISVTDRLCAAGADPTTKGGKEGLTPLQRATELGCQGMMIALQRRADPSKRGQYNNFTALEIAKFGETEEEQLLRDPWKFVSRLSISDIAWLKQQDANLFCMLDVEDENNVFEKPFCRRYSCIETIALAGIVELMAQLSGLALHYEKPDETAIDKWTLAVISSNVERYIPPDQRHGSWSTHHFWKPEEIKTIRDYLLPTNWEVQPLLYIACQRLSPNMEMLRVLVEVCGVDVNGLTTQYCARSQYRQESSYSCILQYLATKQNFWHLDAIQYLIAKGADVNATDKKNRTALHHACESKLEFSDRFVELLLELGADPYSRDDKECSSVDLVRSPEKLQILGRFGVDISKSMTDSLWLGIGDLNIELVTMALDSGIDVNQREEEPVYTRKELDWQIHSTALGEKHPAVPLAGALLYSDYLQTDESPTGEDYRSTLIRLLLDRGADPFAPYVRREYTTTEEGQDGHVTSEAGPLLHYVFSQTQCKRKHLEVFLEYADRLDLNRRDADGRTVFLAACNSSLTYYGFDAFRKAEFSGSDDVVDHESEEVWDSSGLFLKMISHGADVSAVDNDGNNALHILLSNPCVYECYILNFLQNPLSHPLIHAKDSGGFNPLQLALKVLRPATVEALLSLGASLREDPDPEGYSPLHRIAGQCFMRHVPQQNNWQNACRLIPRPKDFLAQCKKLWHLCLDAGMDINAPDATLRGNPPLFHYLAHHAITVRQPYSFTSAKFLSETECHVRSFDDFFRSDGTKKDGPFVNLHVKNNAGDGALHIVTWNEVDLDGEKLDYGSRRSQKHDAEVMRFLVTRKGLDPFMEDAKGRSSLDLAAHLGRQGILDVFKQRN